MSIQLSLNVNNKPPMNPERGSQNSLSPKPSVVKGLWDAQTSPPQKPAHSTDPLPPYRVELLTEFPDPSLDDVAEPDSPRFILGEDLGSSSMNPSSPERTDSPAITLPPSIRPQISSSSEPILDCHSTNTEKPQDLFIDFGDLPPLSRKRKVYTPLTEERRREKNRKLRETRAKEPQHKKEERNAKSRMRNLMVRVRRSIEETPKEKAERLERHRMKMRAFRAKNTPEQTEMRLAKRRAAYARKKAKAAAMEPN